MVAALREAELADWDATGGDFLRSSEPIGIEPCWHNEAHEHGRNIHYRTSKIEDASHGVTIERSEQIHNLLLEHFARLIA